MYVKFAWILIMVLWHVTTFFKILKASFIIANNGLAIKSRLYKFGLDWKGQFNCKRKYLFNIRKIIHGKQILRFEKYKRIMQLSNLLYNIYVVRRYVECVKKENYDINYSGRLHVSR